MVTVGKDGLFFSEKLVLGCDVTDGGMESDVVVVIDEFGDEALSLLEVEGGAGADAIGFEGFMPALDLAVGLGVVGGGFDVGEPGKPDEFLEVFGNELRAVIGDDARFVMGIFFDGALEDDFDVGLGHGVA